MNQEEYIERIKKEWLINNSHKSQLLSSSIIPLRPDIGSYITVNGIDIPKDIFSEEYSQIIKEYYKVLDKLDKYYKENK